MQLSIDINDNNLEKQITEYISTKHKRVNDLMIEALRDFFNKKQKLTYQTQNPKLHSRIIDFELEEENEQLFKDVSNVQEFSKQLREKAWK